MLRYKNDRDYSCYLGELQLLKLLHDIGIFDLVCAGIMSIGEDDYYELIELSMEHVAPISDCDDIPIGWNEEELSEETTDDYYGDHYHRVYHFSDPAMQEYYALCRIYELRHTLLPEQNPFIIEAHDFFSYCFSTVAGQFNVSIDNNKYGGSFVIENCPDYGYDEIALILSIHKSLEFYRENLTKLRLEIITGMPLLLPMLPAPEGAEIA